MRIYGTVRESSEFRLTAKPSNQAASTFSALTAEGGLFVTRRLEDLWSLPDDTPVLAHWHGQYRTDGFRTTVGDLKRKADDNPTGN